MKWFLLSLVIACSNNKESLEQNLGKEAWDYKNRPEIFSNLKDKFLFSSKFDSLPLKGKITKDPWSGDYWPTFLGGITYRWNHKSYTQKDRVAYEYLNEAALKDFDLKQLSPSEKYDLFLGNLNFGLTRFERKRTKVLKTVLDHENYDPDFKIPTWEGLCHAWAPATLYYENPAPITVKGRLGHMIPFGSSDVKALLTYFLNYNPRGETSFLGSRCNQNFLELRELLKKGEIDQEEYQKRLVSSACKDVNAGAFHVVLVNQISTLNEGFIADITRDYQVWNQPVFGFESKILEDNLPPSKTAAEGTVREISIETTMDYISEVPQTFEKDQSKSRFSKVFYRYRLEINADGEIIGGEWLQEEHPDFLWKRIPVEFSGPFLPLKKIYEQSIVENE